MQSHGLSDTQSQSKFNTRAQSALARFPAGQMQLVTPTDFARTRYWETTKASDIWSSAPGSELKVCRAQFRETTCSVPGWRCTWSRQTRSRTTEASIVGRVLSDCHFVCAQTISRIHDTCLKASTSRGVGGTIGNRRTNNGREHDFDLG